MSMCSKKCNEIKGKIDSISGLDDYYVYTKLSQLEAIVDDFTSDIKEYADKDELNGTCFKRYL